PASAVHLGSVRLCRALLRRAHKGRHPAEKQRNRSNGGRRASRFPFPYQWLDSPEPTWDLCWHWALSAETACFKYRMPNHSHWWTSRCSSIPTIQASHAFSTRIPDCYRQFTPRSHSCKQASSRVLGNSFPTTSGLQPSQGECNDPEALAA